MGNVTLKDSGTTTDISVVRRQLLAGKLAAARHELYILSDEGASDDAFYLAKSVVQFFEGDESGALKLLQKVKSIEEAWPIELERLYGQLLVEGAICKLLMHDTHADLVEMALEKAETLLVSGGQRLHAAATTYVEILDHVATGKDTQALSLHQKMASAWAESTDMVIQSWKQVLDMAVLRSLCEHTRLADRLFVTKRADATGYEREQYGVDVLDAVLGSDAPLRTRLTAIRIFIFGRVGVWS